MLLTFPLDLRRINKDTELGVDRAITHTVLESSNNDFVDLHLQIGGLGRGEVAVQLGQDVEVNFLAANQAREEHVPPFLGQLHRWEILAPDNILDVVPVNLEGQVIGKNQNNPLFYNIFYLKFLPLRLGCRACP